MSIEFLGHKQALIGFLLEAIVRNLGEPPREVCDLFCGTGAVSRAFKELGARVVANDHLVFCSTLAEAALLNDKSPTFKGLPGSVTRGTGTPYQNVLAHLNGLRPVEGFFFHNFSPASARSGGPARMYFTEANAARIDAIRRRIAKWEGLLSRGESALLLTDLIRATNAVSNIAGTYGCYLKRWKARALAPLLLTPSTLGGSRPRRHEVFCEDAHALAPKLSCRVVYIDPPYTKRQYSAYYHVLETLVVDDSPVLVGSTGLRPWQEKASDYCYRRKAPRALDNLLANLDCEHLFFSYNEDGQIPHEHIMEILLRHGRVQVSETGYRRYKSSALKHRGTHVIERLYHLHRAS